VVSACKSRTYQGNARAFEEVAESWIKREARRIAKIEVPTAETAALDSIRKAAAMAQDDAEITVIVGECGTG
jgi:ABC-type proline/glycine betaine transport system permease subunit